MRVCVRVGVSACKCVLCVIVAQHMARRGLSHPDAFEPVHRAREALLVQGLAQLERAEHVGEARRRREILRSRNAAACTLIMLQRIM